MSDNLDLQVDPSDVEKNKGMAIVAYIIFFIPLLAAKDSKYAMYHANQGLSLFILSLIINVVGKYIPFIGWTVIVPFGNLLVFVLAILGIIKAAGGKMEPLPVIGNYTLLNKS